MSSAGQRRPDWKVQHALIWTNAAAAALLAKVAPFLTVKSSQAFALLDFHRHIRQCPRPRDRSGRLLTLSPKEQAFRERFYQHLKDLNARGASASRVERKRRSRRTKDGPSADYVAGLIDAEGSLMIAKVKATESWNAQYRARIAVANTDRSVLEDITREFGGILVNEYRAQPGWKTIYQVVWTGGMVEKLLLSVAPHLRLKRAHADVLKRLIRHRKNTHQGRRGGRGRFFGRLPPLVIAHRERLYRQIRELNAKGPRVDASARTSARSVSRQLKRKASRTHFRQEQRFGPPEGRRSQATR